MSGGLVYVFGRIPNEQLFAFRVGCATDGSRCSPVWSRQAGETWASTKWHHRISDEAVQFSPVVAGGVVYVIGITGQVYAFDARTGDRLWIGQTGTASIVGGDRFNQVGVSDGKVFVAAGTGLYAFPEGCATSGTECRPLWVGKSHENQFSEPVVVNGVVYVGSFVDSNTGEVAAFPADCHPHGGVCAPLWVDRSGEATSYYRQVAGNHVFATSGVTGFTDAFPVDCLQSCAPDWRATVFRPGRRATQLPLVSGDLVFTVNGAMLQAFDQNSATGGTTCPALWSWRSPDPSSVISTPTSVGAKLLVTTSAGRIYAFTPGGVSYVRDLQHRTVPCSMTFCGRM